MLEHELKTCKLLRERRRNFEDNEAKILRNISPQIIKRIDYIIDKINGKLKNSKIEAWEFSTSCNYEYIDITTRYDQLKNRSASIKLYPSLPHQESEFREDFGPRDDHAGYNSGSISFHYSMLLGESLILKVNMSGEYWQESFSSYVFFRDSIRLWNFLSNGNLSIPMEYITNDNFEADFEKGYLMRELEKN